MKRSRNTIVIAAAIFGSITAAAANECAGNTKVLGTSRTLAVNPQAFPLVGKVQYQETLQLKNREVVLTFDDGPSAPYTEMVLEALAAECVKATFFLLGKNAVEDPDLVRRIAHEGHSVGTHAFNHVALNKLSIDEAKNEIELGIKAASDALRGDRALTPFFRAPMLALSSKLEKHLVSRGQMVWSIDVDSLDWSDIPEEQVIEDTIKKLEKAGKGIVLMHDIQPVTARALPRFLEELKRRNFRVVHVVPAAATPRVKKTSGIVR